MKNYNEVKEIPEKLVSLVGDGQLPNFKEGMEYPVIEPGNIYYANVTLFNGEKITTFRAKEVMLVANVRKGWESTTMIVSCECPNGEEGLFKVCPFLTIYDDDKDFVVDLCEGSNRRGNEKKPLKEIFPEVYRECVQEVDKTNVELTDRFIGYYFYDGKANSTIWSAGPKYVWKDECGEHIIYDEKTSKMYYKSRKECVLDNIQVSHFKETNKVKEFIIPVKVKAKSLEAAYTKLGKMLV